MIALLRALSRSSLALGGAALAASLVALHEARVAAAAAALAGGEEIPLEALALGELGVLAPVAVAIGVAVAGMLFVVHPQDTASGPLRALIALREGPALDRLRAAAAAPAAIFAAFAWLVVCAHLARDAMGAGEPAEAGLTLGVGSILALLAAGASALAAVPLLRRLLALGSASVPRLLDPALTGGVAVVVSGALFAIGVARGDASGGGGGVLGIFGVLKRSELDLRPLANVSAIALGALIAPLVLARGGRRAGAAAPALAGSILLTLLLTGLCARAGARLSDPPGVARAVEEHAPLGKLSLALLRRATDRDKDGFSSRFGGGDCDDADARINPNALDVPGNGVDEDCSGADTPAPAAPEPVDVTEGAAATTRPSRTFNVVLLTVDTLRPDLGFMGYEHATSPNLDKVAEKATVFEQAYALASYTGKAIGPMLIGKYPSETFTDFSHFNTYFEKNVFVTERLRDAGVRTFAGMCHWYFRNPTGLRQGFDVWDTSAIPPGMGDNDNVVTSDRMADLALRLLSRPENVTGAVPVEADAGAAADTDAGAAVDTDAGAAVAEADARAAVHAVAAGERPFRFFAWFHFFDPHAQYVAHAGAPDFTAGTGASRALYDQEIWYTDKHIGRVLDFIAAQPWGEETAIIMTADHGEAFHEHGMRWHGAEIWQELVHVPLFVYVPGAEPRRVRHKRSQIDLAPTILELMGVPLPAEGELRGKSLLADVHLPEGAEREERDVYIDMPQGPFNGPRRAIISGPSPGLKLIHAGGSSYRLFDLAADPGERKDLSADKEQLRDAIGRMNALRARLKEIEVKPR